MLPFPVSRDDRASMAAEAGVADVGRESKGLAVGFEEIVVAANMWKPPVKAISMLLWLDMV
jgi:hypothetical protein